MKTTRCNLTKACQIFATFTESLYKNISVGPDVILCDFFAKIDFFA